MMPPVHGFLDSSDVFANEVVTTFHGLVLAQDSLSFLNVQGTVKAWWCLMTLKVQVIGNPVHHFHEFVVGNGCLWITLEN
jgi:hypothetical protein